MTTTTAQAANVLSHLEYYLQIVWPELNECCFNYRTVGWSSDCRTELKKIIKNYFKTDVSNETLPFMGYVEGNLSDFMLEFLEFLSGELMKLMLNQIRNFMWEK